MNGAQWFALDVWDRRHVVDLMAAVQPDVVVNTAYQQAHWTSTADGAAHVALAAARLGARLLHVCSDAVFSGHAPRYDETAPPDPTSSYGVAKAAAETAVRAISPDAVIARTSLIVDDGSSVDEHRVHSLAADASTGVLFTDDARCPLHVGDLAAALLELAAFGLADICHIAGADALSRHELGGLIVRRDGPGPAALPSGGAPRPTCPGRWTCVWTTRPNSVCAPNSAAPAGPR